MRLIWHRYTLSRRLSDGTVRPVTSSEVNGLDLDKQAPASGKRPVTTPLSVTSNKTKVGLRVLILLYDDDGFEYGKIMFVDAANQLTISGQLLLLLLFAGCEDIILATISILCSFLGGRGGTTGE